MTASVEFRRVSKWYGHVLGISDVSLAIGEGVFGLLGTNGAGKSTILKLAAGLIGGALGEVRVLGEDPRLRSAVRRAIGLCPDIDRFYERMSGVAWVELMARLSGLGRSEAAARSVEYMERVGMREAMSKPIGAYSKGMRQRIKLAQALVHEPRVLLLDEPLTGLDPVGRDDMVRLIRSLGDEGRTVLVSSNVLGEIELMTQRLILIHQGRILAEGTIRDIRDQMADRPHRVEIRTRTPRQLAARLIRLSSVGAIEMADHGLVVQVRESMPFFDEITRFGGEPDSGIETIVALDEDLDSVFAYLVSS